MSDEDRTRRSTVGWWPDAPSERLGAPAQRYVDLRPHQKGGMGEVHRATDASLGVPVALKLLAAEQADNPAAQRAFHAEAQLTAGLGHPAIVLVQDRGEWHDGRPFYVMRWIEGPTLRERIARLHAAAGPEAWGVDAEGGSLRRLVELLVAVCDALAYAHARGVVHRDLKPSNVIVAGPGQPVVIDWGLAWSADWVEEGYAWPKAAGTPGYACAEQVAGSAIPAPTWDVWALGATLYEILAGERPYGREAGLGRVLEGPPEPVERRASRPLDPGLVAITARALQPEAKARYPDAGALAVALRGWLDGDARRARALELVAEAQQLAHELEKMRNEIRSAEAENEAKRVENFLSMPEDYARELWRSEDRVNVARRALVEAESRHLERLQMALQHDPDSREARAALATAAVDLHRAAEARDDSNEASRWEEGVRRYQDGRFDDYLVGDGWLSLETDPPGAIVELARYELDGRRLVPRPWGRPLRAPLREVALPMGSWLLTLRAPGRAPVRYPVSIRRQGRWPAPEHGALPTVYLPREDELHPEERYVPAGPYLSGGDPRATRPAPRRWVTLPGFTLRRDPVTMAEYLDFLNALAARGPVDPMLVLRDRAPGDKGEPTIAWDGARFSLKEGSPRLPWDPRLPVIYVHGDGARAYAGWAAARDGLPWRLPDASWVEKAARGVDGRCFPMGDTLLGVWSWTRDSGANPVWPRTVDEMRDDESPYGIFGLSGNVRTWCADFFDDTSQRTAGGAWTYPADTCRAGNRMWHTPDTRLENVGIRLARLMPG